MSEIFRDTKKPDMTLGMRLRQLFFDALSILLPFRCHRCKADTPFNTVLCDNCLKELGEALHSPVLIQDTCCSFKIYTMSSYTSMVSDLVKIIKYRPSRKMLKVLSEQCLVKGALKEFLTKNDILVPVPMHAKRLAERGFNQADCLAEAFSGSTAAGYCHAVVRSRFTRPQADCTEKERLTNLNNAFILARHVQKESFRNRRIILIDDVATTGTTLQKCAAALKELPAAEICALVVSHSYKHVGAK